MSVLRRRSAATELRVEYDKRLMLVSGRANRELAAKIADKLGVELGARDDSRRSPTARSTAATRSRSAAPTCSSSSRPAATPPTGLSANDALMELLMMVDAAVGGSAHRVIAVTPWYGYSRQDKKSAPREPISARLVARMLESAGIDRILTMDLHSGQIQGFFQKPCDHMTALFMLTQYFADLGLEDLVVVAPDAGRVKLNKQFASKIGADLAILNKERPAQQVAEINYVIGDVRGQDRAARRRHHRHGRDAARRRRGGPRRRRPPRLRRRDPRLFSGNAWENLTAAGFEQVVVTDTDPAPAGRPRQRPRPLLRRPAHELDPPDLHGRLGERRVRRREPAVLDRTASTATTPRRTLMPSSVRGSPWAS